MPAPRRAPKSVPRSVPRSGPQAARRPDRFLPGGAAGSRTRRGRLPNIAPAAPEPVSEEDRVQFVDFIENEDGSSIEAAKREREPPPAPPPTAGELIRRLRKGDIQIGEESRKSIRLMDAPKAQRVARDFLAARQANGKRLVLLVHGQGHNSPGGRGVLRELVPEWLREWVDVVEGFDHAARKDGGAGALYVVLRPRNPPPPKTRPEPDTR